MKMDYNRLLLIKSVVSHCSRRWASTVKNKSTTDYCVDLVRQYDNENFLCSLMLPHAVRTTAFAIRAFNIEIARIQDQTNSPNIAQMRLKFWEESIDNIYDGKPPKNPVAIELFQAIKRHKLTKAYFKRLITSRWKQMNSPSFNTAIDMETYADHTSASVYFLILEAAGVKSIKCDHVASHLGKAHGVTNLLRALPYNLKNKQILLPQSIMMQHNVSEEEIFRGTFKVEFRRVIFDVASTANQHLEKARSLDDELPSVCRLIFLPATPVSLYLYRLRKHRFDVFDPNLNRRNPLVPFLLFWRKLIRSY